MRNPETNPFSLIVKTIQRHSKGLVAFMLTGTCCYLWLNKIEVPKELLGFTGMVVGYLFGGKPVADADSDSK